MPKSKHKETTAEAIPMDDGLALALHRELEAASGESAQALDPTRKQRLDVLALELGYTPQFIPGPGGRFRANGLAENPRFSDFAAARVRRRWDDDTQVTKEEIEAAIAEVATVTIR